MKFSEAINQALIDEMRFDSKVICLGLGVTDPKGVFGTTLDLNKKFGNERVFDIPASENSITGVCAGLALGGYRPVLTHQRLDFAILSFDQIINNIAKAHYMFGAQINMPLVIRMIIGRGWGQGPTHSQNLQLMMSGTPGLHVVYPATTQDAYSQLRQAIKSPDPVIFLEHRWLHNQLGEISQCNIEYCSSQLLDNTVIREGSDITIACYGYMVIEAMQAARILKSEYKVSAEVINMRSYTGDYRGVILKSVSKTNYLVIADTAQECFTISHRIAYDISMISSSLSAHPLVLAMPSCPEPTSHFLTKDFYNNSSNIINSVLELLGIEKNQEARMEQSSAYHDVPGEWFTGPF